MPPWRSPLMATPLSWADLANSRTTGAAGVRPQRQCLEQQGADKLVGTGAHRVSESGLPLGQGMSVALAADGDRYCGWVAVGGSVGVHPQSWYLVAARQAARWRSVPDPNGPPTRLCRTRALPMATPHGGGLVWTMTGPARCGCSAAVVVSGRSKARSSSALARREAASQGMSLALSADGNRAHRGSK